MDKLDRIVDAMKNLQIDVLISTSSENSTYVGDISDLSPPLVQGAPICTLVFRERPRDAIILSPAGLSDLLAKKTSWIRDMRLYGTFFVNSPSETNLSRESEEYHRILGGKCSDSIYSAISNALLERGLQKGRVAIDEKNFAPLQFRTLKSKLPEIDLLEASDVFRRIRMKKFSYEIAKLEKAVEVTESAWSCVLETLREGITEVELNKTFVRSLIAKDASPYFHLIAIGDRGALPNAPPSSRQLKKGDLIRFDGGCEYDRYKADIARIAVYGPPSERYVNYYKAILAGEEAAIDQIRPGTRCSDLFTTAVETVKRSGIPHYRRHHCGHGIGLEMYDPPLVSPNDQTELEEDFVMNIETPYYELGLGGLQVEDTILVTNSGFRYLTKSSRELKIV